MGLEGEGARAVWHSRLALYAVCAAIILGLRAKSVHEPLERDHATYAVIARELLAGRRLYSDLWDNKPPAIFWTFAAAEVVLGYGETMVFVLGLVTAVATVPAIHRAASALDPKAGLWAALSWSVACNDLVLQANQPNAEAFMNLFTAWAFALLARRSPELGAWQRVVAAGVLLAVASVYKQVVVFMGLSLALALAVEARTWRKAAILVASLGLPGIIAWVAIAGAFAIAGTFDDFWMTVFVHSRRYAGDLSANLEQSVSWGQIASLTRKPVLIQLGLLTAFGMLDFRRDGGSGLRLLLAAWIAGTHVAVAAPGHFWPHYDQLWLPPLAVGAGCGAARLGRLAGLAGREGDLACGLALLAVLATVEAPLITLNAKEASVLKHGEVFLNVRDLGRNVGGLLKPGESLYVWGPEPGLFFYSGRRPVTGVLWDDPLFDSVMASGLSRRTLAELERGRPELVVTYTTNRNAAVEHPILDWIARHYRALPRTRPRRIHDPELAVLIDGRLDRRAPGLTWEDVMDGRTGAVGMMVRTIHER